MHITTKRAKVCITAVWGNFFANVMSLKIGCLWLTAITSSSSLLILPFINIFKIIHNLQPNILDVFPHIFSPKINQFKMIYLNSKTAGLLLAWDSCVYVWRWVCLMYWPVTIYWESPEKAQSHIQPLDVSPGLLLLMLSSVISEKLDVLQILQVWSAEQVANRLEMTTNTEIISHNIRAGNVLVQQSQLLINPRMQSQFHNVTTHFPKVSNEANVVKIN